MIRVSIQFKCGCGYHTDKQTEAIEHCAKNNHNMDIIGSVKTDKKVKGRVKK
jgi:hypothetical protein